MNGKWRSIGNRLVSVVTVIVIRVLVYNGLGSLVALLTVVAISYVAFSAVRARRIGDAA